MSDAGVAAPLLWIGEHDFAEDLRSTLAVRLGNPPIIDREHIATTPVLITPAYLARLDRLNQLLNKALHAIVERYFADYRIRSIYALSETMEAILRLTQGRPYRVGWHRPDLVHDTAGRPRVCEIGARYPLNGWMVSERAAEAAVKAGLSEVTRYGFVDALCSQYRSGDTVAMLHADEAGTEIFFLAEALRERSIDFVSVSPAAIELEGGELRTAGRTIDHVILEMDRSELPLIPGDVLQHLIEAGNYFNDIRTLILVHDKRVLAVLWDDAIRRDLLCADEAEELHSFLIPSWTVTDASGCEALLSRNEDMIAKRSSGGRGIDALVRRECSEAVWRARIERDWSKDMYQYYLPQCDFGAPGADRATNLVGLQLCRDATSYGPGIFRGSNASVINLHGDRGLIYVPLIAQ